MIRTIALAAAAAMACSAATLPASAADYPEKPVTALVGFAAGGGVDTYARALAAAMGDNMNGQPLVVVNKPGGAQVPAMKEAANAKPDGYTVIIFSVGSGLFTTMQRDRGVDPIKDFAPIAQIGDNHLVMLAAKSTGWKTPQDVLKGIEDANAKGEKIRWGHAGRGGITQMAAVAWLLKNDAYDKVQDVPFNGGSTARNALIGDQVDFASVALTNITGFEDQLNIIGIFSAEREPSKPDVPTVKESGTPTTPMSNPIIVMGPKGMPKDRIDTLAAALKKATETDTYKKITSKAGQPVVYKSPEASGEYIKELKDEWQPVVDFAKKNIEG